MITVYEAVYYKQSELIKVIEQAWGPIKVETRRDPEDDYEFRFFDKLMRQKPRR